MTVSSVLTDPRSVLLARLLLGGPMVLAAMGKLARRRDFEQLLHDGFGFRESHARLTARLLPPLELVLGLTLVVGLLAPVAAGGNVVLLVAFTLLLTRMRLLGHKELKCGCFGDPEMAHGTLAMIVRNLVMIVLGVIVLVAPSAYLAVGGLAANPADGVPRIDGLAVVLTAVGLMILVALAQVPPRLREMVTRLGPLPKSQ